MLCFSFFLIQTSFNFLCYHKIIFSKIIFIIGTIFVLMIVISLNILINSRYTYLLNLNICHHAYFYFKIRWFIYIFEMIIFGISLYYEYDLIKEELHKLNYIQI